MLFDISHGIPQTPYIVVIGDVGVVKMGGWAALDLI